MLVLLILTVLLNLANSQILFGGRFDEQEELPSIKEILDIFQNDTEVEPDFEEDFSGAQEEFIMENPDLDSLEDTEAIRDSVSQTPTAIEEYENTINDFTQDFLTQAYSETENLVFSPFSLHTALAILTSGASDNSTIQSELLLALGRVQNIQGLELRYKSLLNEYLELEQLSFGNGFWTAKRYYEKINGKFLEGLSSLYQIDVQALTQRPVEQINNWVKKQTKGKIDNIITVMPPNIAFLIVNALYFKAAWTVKFEENTEPQEFTKLNGQKILVPMMKRTSFHNIATKFTTNLLPQMEFLALAIPYDDLVHEDRFEMVILMPENYRALDFLQESLTRQQDNPDTDNIFDVAEKALELKRFDRKEHTITMPSFKIDSNFSVKDQLKKMGIVSAFEEGNFENIVFDEPIKLSDVKHRALIEVTTDGTSGSAATTIELVSFAATFDIPKEINVNKPFLFYIKDRVQKAILFAGKYSNPLN